MLEGKEAIDKSEQLVYNKVFVATFRKEKTLCGLKHYQEAIEAITTFQILLQRIEASTYHDNVLIGQNTEKSLNHAIPLDSENRNGQYNYPHIFNKFYEKIEIKKTHQSSNDDLVYKIRPRLDHADFLIDYIEIYQVEEKGEIGLPNINY
ncbi:hypothetical protein GLOIN_2v1644476 [Rhizophagus clarus]|uniref:Uncharacterized protein n=1 Tax=Rhizophagus clarus TaxID=94130 RepID=A0A8H3R9D8_9GLOM|nr:hypothetical protein GLOIN_2v1644476 [Rhizophagus clarus]